MERKLISLGLGMLTLAIILGAYAAHGLESRGIEEKAIKSFETGVRYIMYTSFGFLLLSQLQQRFDFEIKSQFRQILWGTVLFSLSIFALVLSPLFSLDVKSIMGPLTPIGGGIMIIGWAGIFIKYIRTA